MLEGADFRVSDNGALREVWDDIAHTYTAVDVVTGAETVRVYTPEEAAEAEGRVLARTLSRNRTHLEAQALGALDANRAFLGVTAPDALRVAAQVRALTSQNSGIIRLLLNRLEATD